MKILGIESSCDETAAAVVEDGYKLLSNVVASSMDLHADYGGVVPEIAARSHIEAIIPTIKQALAEAMPTSNFQLPTSKFNPWDQIDGIAVTYGAGLGGCLLVGVMAARTLAIIKHKPLWRINHVEAHVYANFLTEVSSISNSQLANYSDGQGSALGNYKLAATQPEFPLLALIVSGGHSQLALFKNHFDYRLLGQTQDDAIGEAFDKVAKILGLPYPGGPSIGQKALAGDPQAFDLPKAKMLGKYDFSFSGLKTAVLRLAQTQIGADYAFPSYGLPERLNEAQKADIAGSFQRVAVETVVDKTILAFHEFRPKSVVIAGGVAASPELRRQLANRLPIAINYPDPKLCTDNAAMVATLGCFQASASQTRANPYSLAIEPNLSM
ncbi:MAG: tRNA (adenosine(37)-N6)-threonylcarbamoyltransferase complex transferase subunit TsaD [Candidatus Saccharimonadales bacterium]